MEHHFIHENLNTQFSEFLLKDKNIYCTSIMHLQYQVEAQITNVIYVLTNMIVLIANSHGTTREQPR